MKNHKADGGARRDEVDVPAILRIPGEPDVPVVVRMPADKRIGK